MTSFYYISHNLYFYQVLVLRMLLVHTLDLKPLFYIFLCKWKPISWEFFAFSLMWSQFRIVQTFLCKMKAIFFYSIKKSYYAFIELYYNFSVPSCTHIKWSNKSHKIEWSGDILTTRLQLLLTWIHTTTQNHRKATWRCTLLYQLPPPRHRVKRSYNYVGTVFCLCPPIPRQWTNHFQLWISLDSRK